MDQQQRAAFDGTFIQRVQAWIVNCETADLRMQLGARQAKLNERFVDQFGQKLIEAVASIADTDDKNFTIALKAPFPLLLGGHTLVSGAFWTMVEAAWHGHPE